MPTTVAEHGVNLGGWFIPEKWMTPELFAELEVSDAMGLLQTEVGRKRYARHVEVFIQEADIEFLAQNHETLLRVPIAWWMISDEYDAIADVCRERLDWLFRLAENHNLKILLDYHAARGSQNGKDHSGKRGVIGWQKYKTQNIEYLVEFTRRYANSSALWGIELLNEPVVKGNFWTLYQYYRGAKKRLKSIIPSSLKIIIHDGFIPMLFTNIAPWRSSMVLDMHLYEIEVDNGESVQEYFDRRDTLYRKRIKFYSRFQLVIIGEWSGVIPERFLKELSNEERAEVIRENIARQLELYKAADAWMFWSYKTADEMMWNFKSLLAREKELL